MEKAYHTMTYLLSASILSANFANLGEECKNVLHAGADRIHFDVMDNHYVPNLTVGPLVCKALRNYGIDAPIDVHLMTNPVDRLIEDFAKAGASVITFHPEATENIQHSLDLIKKHKCNAGLAINPNTPFKYLEDYIDHLDEILLMSVNPGFAGQAFIPESVENIKKAKAILDKHKKQIPIAVDGGIKLDNISTVAKAGASIFVAGSAIFNTENYSATINAFREKLLIR
ncbi:MAG: ribulose-phosphate 3-epimerase [Gammaproteobacteria bacterium]|nr:ribulose-phosphate 3-epimerase [Gammaproteobacteria bacterium]